jgi:hypothetical protein
VTIQVTDEMIAAFDRARADLNQEQMHGRPPICEDTKRRAGLAAVLAIVERDYLSVLADLVDPDPCWFDHHGGCQAHGYLSLEPGELCPHEQAKRLLAASVDS